MQGMHKLCPALGSVVIIIHLCCIAGGQEVASPRRTSSFLILYISLHSHL